MLILEQIKENVPFFCEISRIEKGATYGWKSFENRMRWEAISAFLIRMSSENY